MISRGCRTRVVRPEKVFVALLILSLFFPFSNQPTIAQTLEDDDLQDLPAMAINVGDLVKLGYEGFVTRTSALLSEDAFMTQQLAMYPEQAADLETYIDDGDFVAAYDLFAEIEDEDLYPSTRVRTYIYQFEDRSGADDWFDFREGEDEDVETGLELGTSSELSYLEGEVVDYEANTSQFDYTFVAGSYVAGIQVTEFTYEGTLTEADQEMTEELAELLAEKIEAVLDEGGPALGNRIVRFENGTSFFHWHDDAVLIADNDMYTTIDFQYLPMYVDRPEDAEQYSADNEERGIETEYSYQPGVYLPEIEEWQAISVWVRTWTDEETAEAYVADPESAGYDGVPQEEQTDLGEWGEQSHVYTNEFEVGGETFIRYEVLVQYGNITVWVKYGDLTEAGFDGIAEYLDATDECMQEVVCDEEVPFPY